MTRTRKACLTAMFATCLVLVSPAVHAACSPGHGGLGVGQAFNESDIGIFALSRGENCFEDFDCHYVDCSYEAGNGYSYTVLGQSVQSTDLSLTDAHPAQSIGAARFAAGDTLNTVIDNYVRAGACPLVPGKGNVHTLFPVI